MKNGNHIFQQYSKYVMPTYAKTPLVIVKGKGARVWDINGKTYLDFFPGWAVSGLGHCHPRVTQAVSGQLKKILHVPNNYYNELQGRLAEKIIRYSFDGKVFFSNSGAEAVEGAIKLTRRWGSHANKYEIICMNNSFHGRTLAAITATGQKKYKKGFGPLPGGFIHVPFNDLERVEAKLTKKTVAILLEVVQGEGGIVVANKNFVRGLRKLCDKRRLLLIIDEVQTGIGRTGEMFAYKHYGITPDVMVLAKSLGGGFPIGALVAKRKYADTLTPGTHASTFGGSPIICAASLAVFEAIEKGRLLQNARHMGKYLMKKLKALKDRYGIIKDVRGINLMAGLGLSINGRAIVDEARSKGLLINCTHDTVLRIMPPITVKKKEIDEAIGILDEALNKHI